jgi:hypothetical protein
MRPNRFTNLDSEGNPCYDHKRGKGVKRILADVDRHHALRAVSLAVVEQNILKYPSVSENLPSECAAIWDEWRREWN